MSADLDRLRAAAKVAAFGRRTVTVSVDTIRRIAADYAKVEAERDYWRAIAEESERSALERREPTEDEIETLKRKRERQEWEEG